jgi:photosystem II stability/assembly factor-like uncharacterized protein
MHNRPRMSLTLVRLVATFFVAACGVVATGLTPVAAASDNTWAPAGAFAEKLNSPVFALAVDPADYRRTLVGTASGTIYLSPDAGTSWRPMRKTSGHAVLALAFDPARPGTILAGTRGAGVWRSADNGLSWQSQQGSEARTVRAFAFANGAALAATDQGVLSSRDGGPWSSAGLPQVRVSALAVVPASSAAANGMVVAGGDATQGPEPLPVFTSGDGGQTWAALPVTGPAGVVGGSSMVAALASGPEPRQGARMLLMGTNTGLFMTRDRGANWQQLTGGGGLPATDITSVAPAPRRTDRLYVASDGGGSAQGGLWVSTDTGGHFASLAPPVPEVTALAVTGDDTPTLVVATFRPTDQSVALWTYRDAGGQPQGPVALQPSPRTAPSAHGAPRTGAGGSGLKELFAHPEAPYLALGVGALAVVLLAAVAYLRRGRQL